MISKTQYYCAEQHIPYTNLAVEAYLLESVPRDAVFYTCGRINGPSL